MLDPDLIQELTNMCEEDIQESFCRHLAFGTGGLRGILGAGTNRMNVYTVMRASQGVANYIKKVAGEGRKIAISYDSRIKSDVFARVSAGVFAANGLQVHIFKELMPTPCLSYAVRALQCFAGIMITASHNPADYNGYKVYGEDGCQITEAAADRILGEMECIDPFKNLRYASFEEGMRTGRITYIDGALADAYLEEVKRQSVTGKTYIDRNLSIVYTPLCGTGKKPVLAILERAGFSNVILVSEQSTPNGQFPTCPRPNPENAEALSLGLKYAKQRGADLLLATDPDCDRVGVVARDKDGAYKRLSGNEVGLLLLEYICRRRKADGTMPAHPVFIRTIVTSELSERIAQKNGLRTIQVLTGFKYIGEQIGEMEKQGTEGDFVFAFEESCGYLSGTYVRDKDAVNASLLISEMAAFYRAQGKTLPEILENLYEEYGFCVNTLHTYSFEGRSGTDRMRAIMHTLRSDIAEGRICSTVPGTESVRDYSKEGWGLPLSDVLRLDLAGENFVIIRPSGTEPKLKIYISAFGTSKEQAVEKEESICHAMEAVISRF